MRTRMLAVFISLTMLLALLPACQAETEPEAVPPVVLLPAEDIACAVSSAALDEPEEGAETLGEQLETYAEAAYGLGTDEWEDCAVRRATGVRAYEIAVLRFADEAGAARGEEMLTAYRGSREAAFTGYAPKEAELVSKGKVCRVGNYVGLFICEDPAGAEALFTSILETGETPEPAAKPEPEPEPEPVSKPEPAFGLGENQVTWNKLFDPLEAVCSGEIDEIKAAAGKTGFGYMLSSSADNFGEWTENVYGLPSGQLVEGAAALPFLERDRFAFELAVFRMADAKAAEAGMEVLENYRNARMDDFAEDAGQLELLQNGCVSCAQDYIAFFACRNAEEVSAVFEETINALFPDGQGAADAYQNPEKPPRIEIAAGVFVTEARWPEPEGEADPDHPGRILYSPTGNELMEIYDTSAITAAWASGDPSGLSDYDRAIYDSAREVLDGILRDGMSEFEKEVEIYDWVVRNVRYYWDHMDVLTEEERDAYTPYGGLVNGEAVCLGYATAFQLLAELAGLESMTIVGVADTTGDHGWAMVRLNGQWYCVDPTWDASSYEFGMMEGREWQYFNVTSDYMARTHHQWDYDAVPEATAEDYGAAPAA